MPELPEVEQAARLLRKFGKGRLIESVQCNEDKLIFDGVTTQEFCKELEGRRLLDAKRYGKYFYLELDGSGRMPVLHFGMTGYIQVKGMQPHLYAQKKKIELDSWPPRFMKFIIRFKVSDSESSMEIAYADARRLGRIRLRASPATEPPISTLGFDPLIRMPPLDEYESAVIRRKCPIKALLLDQAFNAGVGNWVADEILFHSGIHPERRCNSLSSQEINKLHQNTNYVCQTAVDLDADAKRFPSHWLFNHRWGKGKKSSKFILLPTGREAKIDWVTVGGRTSAFVNAVQPLRTAKLKSKSWSRKERTSLEGDLSSFSENE